MLLKNIVKEYHSKNLIVKKIFIKRLYYAIELASQDILKKTNPSIIDIGCGEGMLIELLKKMFPNLKRITGIDINPNVISLKNQLNVDIKICDIRKTKFLNNHFDIIFCLDILEHFNKKDLKIVIKEIKRIINPKGTLITSLPTENLFYKMCRLIIKGTMSKKYGPCSSPHMHNDTEVIDTLKSEGFKIISQKLLPKNRYAKLFTITSFKLNLS